MKRYAIVRADKFCPRDLERNYKLKCIGSLHCDKCEIKKKYGDTKEQLIKKVAQAIKKGTEDRTGNYGYSLKFYEPIAKFVVEFLGVEQ